jgi:hypothetical protein
MIRSSGGPVTKGLSGGEGPYICAQIYSIRVSEAVRLIIIGPYLTTQLLHISITRLAIYTCLKPLQCHCWSCRKGFPSSSNRFYLILI